MLTRQILIGLDTTAADGTVYLVANCGGQEIQICERPFASEAEALAWFSVRLRDLLEGRLAHSNMWPLRLKGVGR